METFLKKKHSQDGKIVVITGATAGLGRALARTFAREGANIALLARDQDRLEAARKEIEEMGVKALAISMDVAEYEQMESAAAKVEKELGPIDVWINNAMASVFSPIKEMTAEEYRRVTDVTYHGYVYGSMVVLKYMLPRNKGMIIQVGSALAYRGIPLQSAYCGAKHAIQGFTESLRCELMHDGSKVKISMIQLPAMNTPQFNWVKSRLPRKPQPVPPIFQPEVIANAILWAVDHYRREWYIGFPTVKAIYGNRIASKFADWFLAKKGYEAQQYDGLVDPNRKDNLFKPVPGNYAAHGDFDKQATNKCINFWLNKNRTWLLSIAAFLIFFSCLWASL